MTAWLAFALPVQASLAHHGVAPHYDDGTIVRLEGTVARFDFINPHSFVYVTITNDAGDEETWQCELASRSVLSRNGLSADTFAPGSPITVEGAQGRHNATGCAVRTAWFADGSVLRSNELFSPVARRAAEVPGDPDSIAGIWTMKRFAVSFYEGVLTPAGEAARAAFDPIADDPAIYCEPASPVRTWVNVNEPFEIRIEPDRVVIGHRFLDYERVIPLGAGVPPPGAARSAMGFPAGRFEGKALVIESTHFSAGALEPRRAVLHTADMKLTERLQVDGATGELEITWTIDDPAYFIGPLTQTESYVRSSREAEPFDCRPGYQQ